MNLYKKFILFLAIISAVLCLFLIIDTYAKYLTSANSSANISIAKWNIKVNNTSIKNNESLSSVISPVFPGTAHIASGIVAPTAEGYFDLNLNFAEADVSFAYNISISPSDTSNITDIIVTGYSVDNGEPIYFDADDSTNISDNILYDSTSTTTTRAIRVFIKWIDSGDTETMNNIQDTLATLDTTTSLDVNIAFTQIANIVP